MKFFKSIWFWVIALGLIGYYLYAKQKKAVSNAKSAGAGITANPLNNFWGFFNAQSAKSASDNVTAGIDAAKSIFGDVKSIFGSGAKGANSPSSAGSGSAAPSQQQVDNADLLNFGDFATWAPATLGDFSSFDMFGSNG